MTIKHKEVVLFFITLFSKNSIVNKTHDIPTYIYPVGGFDLSTTKREAVVRANEYIRSVECDTYIISEIPYEVIRTHF